MNRRRFVKTAAASAAGLPWLGAGLAEAAVAPTGHPLHPVWRAFAAAHLEADGRIVDGPQGGVSHSEGQGYGMVLAALFGDEDAFRRMFEWTERNLAIRADGLLAWRWSPDASDPTPDLNNASDGDLFYAWALLLGAQAFERPIYAERAESVAVDLTRRCVVENPATGGLLLSPGVDGFVRETSVTINPSYYMPRAMREVANATGQFTLSQCADDGMRLLGDFAASGLTPDWVDVTADGWRMAEKSADRSGYEALRTPLFLVWSGASEHPAVTTALAAHRAARAADPRFTGVPRTATVFDAETMAVRERSADAGYAAIVALADCARTGGSRAAIPPFDPSQPYYPAALHAFALLAQVESYPSCVPI